MTISDWQNSPSTFRIQNENYVGKGLVNFCKTYRGYDGFISNLSSYGLNWYGEIDNSIRIPVSAQNYYGYYAGICTDGAGINTPSSTQMLGAVGGVYNYSESKTEILDYTPRLYVELIPLSEFLSKDLAGYGSFWLDKFIFDTYPTDKAYGFAPYNISLNNIPDLVGNDGYYVLRSYQIYTNKTDGTEQDLLFDSFNDRNDSGLIYDTWTPFKRLKYGTVSVYKEGVVYYPYMQQFSARTRTAQQPYFVTNENSTIGQTGFMGSNMGNLLAGVNVVYAYKTVDGLYNEFAENPFVHTGKMPGGTNANWGKFTTNPFTGHLNNANKGVRFVVATLKEWKKICTGSGMPWSDILDDVIKPDDGDLNKPVKPGQPTNPTDPGSGDGDNISDDIPLPDVKFYPNNNAYNRYWIKPSDLANLQNWIFGETFLNDIRRLWTDPAEYLINISFYPFNGSVHDPASVVTRNISIGNLTSEISANAMLDGYSAKFYGGSFKLAEYYGSYLDYAPYTSAEIYIPYIGYKPLNINDVMGKTINLIYVADWDTNMLTATLMVEDRPLTMYSGSFGVKLAISGTNANQVAETIARGASGIISNVGMAIANVATNNIPGAIGSGIQAIGSIMDTALDVQNSPRQFGTPTPLTGLYNTQVPHVIIHRPIAAEPTDFKVQNGYSASYSAPVSSFEGYLQCNSVKLSGGSTMSETEQNEIISLLTGGIYI